MSSGRVQAVSNSFDIITVGRLARTLKARYRWLIDEPRLQWFLLVAIVASCAGVVAIALTGDHNRLGRPLLGFAGALFGLFTFQKAMLNGSPRAAVVTVVCVSLAVVLVFWNPFGELFRIGELIVATIACARAILLPRHREATESG
jgi:peptidoglycan/LPS O-acetylase OafA/YrhL